MGVGLITLTARTRFQAGKNRDALSVLMCTLMLLMSKFPVQVLSLSILIFILVLLWMSVDGSSAFKCRCRCR